MVPGGARRGWLVPVVRAAIFFVASFGLIGLRVDWDFPEFGRHPDEAAHLITGTLVHDWTAAGCPGSPLEYALRYYARYPKIAIGHWPPAYYGVQAAWYGVFGVGRASATLLSLTIAAAFLTLLFELLRRGVSTPAALLALGLVMYSPVFRYVSTVFMADLLVGVLSLAAVWSFSRYLEGGRAVAALGFGFWSALAIMTKQDAVALAAVPPLSVLFLRRWDLLKDWRFYASAAPVGVVCAPYYLWAMRETHSAWDGLARRSLIEKVRFVSGGFSLCGLPGAVVSAFGLGAAVASSVRSPRLTNFGAVLAAQALGVCALQLATPVSLDPRYKAGLLAFAAFLAANAFQEILGWRRVPAPARAALAIGLALALVFGLPPQPIRKVIGYRGAVEQVVNLHQPGLQTVLVCSDPQGDGAVSAEFRLQNAPRDILVIRADKVLASSTWMNQKYRLLQETPEAIARYLETQPIHFVLIDDWGAESGAHHELLGRLLESHPERYPLLKRFLIERRHPGGNQRGYARLYRVAASADRHPDVVDLTIPGLPGGGRIQARAGDL